MTNQDPLKHADVGETKTIESETQFSFWGGRQADPYLGRDQDYDNLRITGAELVGEKGNEMIKITFEGEATKLLPPNWDREPREKTSRASQPKPLWKRLLPNVASFLLVLTVSVIVMSNVMGKMSGMTINGEAVTFTMMDLLPVSGLIFILGVFVFFGMQYLPGMAGKRTAR